jgi:hypothetical protein
MSKNKNKGVVEGFQDAFKQIKEAASTRKKDREAFFGTNTKESR